jgi:hypothetical protein
MPILAALAVVSCAYWLATVALALRGMWSIQVLAKQRPVPPAAWPKVSIVIPARNEEATLEAATASRLAEGYPNLEVIIVDDRSTDATGEVAARLAASDPRVRVVRVDELPARWLGKVHALDAGTRAATGEWILFCDADVHLREGTLRLAVAHSEARALDHLTLIPRVLHSTFALDVVMAACVRFMCAGSRAWAIENPRRKEAAFGIGAFNLVRRTALEKSEGLAGIRMDIADDVALAKMLKASGARTSLAIGRDLVALHFYESLRDMASGTEKSGFTLVGKFQHARVALMVLLVPALELGAFVALSGGGWVRAMACVTAVVGLAASVFMNRRVGQPAAPALFAPLASLALAWMLARSSLAAIARGGIMWRGTLYSTEMLRANQRYPFF